MTWPANAVESLIELYAERWNRIWSQADADRLQAEIARAAKTVSSEELLAYAAAPNLREQLLAARWNRIGSQVDADRLQAQVVRTAGALSEELAAYAAAPHLRGHLLLLCVFARAQQRVGARRAGSRCEELDGAAAPLAATETGLT